MSCDPQTLLSAASCYACLSPGEWSLLRVAILCRIKNGITMACDVQTLLTEASCYSCLPPGQLALIELALLCQIAAGGSSSGSSQLMQGAANPVAAPPDPTKPAYYTNTTSGVIFTWSVAGAAWI